MIREIKFAKVFGGDGLNVVRAIFAIVAILLSPAIVQADTCVSTSPQPMQYWCLGGLCNFSNPYPNACPATGDVATYRQCSVTNYNNLLYQYWGNLAYLQESVSVTTQIVRLLWQSERNGVYDSDLAPVSCNQFWVSAQPPPEPECGSCQQNALAEPINPANGAMFNSHVDFSSTLGFSRYFNSSNSSKSSLGQGWRNFYSRNVRANYNSATFRQYMSRADNSSLYADAYTACTTGFNQVKSRVAAWANATVSFSNGSCVLSKGGSVVGSLSVYSSSAVPEPYQTPIGFDLIRDDGQLIRFIIDSNNAIVNPPGANLKLQKVASGFAVTDANDNVEQYDTDGKLLSVTSRTGVVQTMNYDGNGRLSGVSDSFGHQLNFNYDSQGHLSTVTRQ